MGPIQLAAIYVIFSLLVLWVLLWTWFRYNRYIKKRILTDQWKVLGLVGFVFLLIILAMILMAVIM